MLCHVTATLSQLCTEVLAHTSSLGIAIHSLSLSPHVADITTKKKKIQYTCTIHSNGRTTLSLCELHTCISGNWWKMSVLDGKQ